MPLIKTVHLGGVNLGKENLLTTFASTRHKVLYELNNFLFDYNHAHDFPIIQIPPLDDWKRSEEDHTCWFVNLPDAEWRIWVRSEIIEF